MSNKFDLERFVKAQERVVETVTKELEAGRKQSHWMWFVFPQLRGLGHSPTAQRYGLSSPAEAEAYLAHPHLGPRLMEWTRTVLSHRDRSAEYIFGYPDYLKFRSCMTLFSRVPEAPGVFQEALDTFYNGEPDQRTLQMIGAQ
jgi:uncharacterized protein (DUF1810 family)